MVMFRKLTTFGLLFIGVNTFGQEAVSILQLDDSIRAVQYYAELQVKSIPEKKESYAGIRTDVVGLYLKAEKNEREIVFQFPSTARVIVKGHTVEAEKDELEWDYEWKVDSVYRLVIAVATDSAANFSLYSGYAWLPELKKWKLIGTCRIDGSWSLIKSPSMISTNGKKNTITVNQRQAWVQRSNGSWKNLSKQEGPNPVVIVTNHIDSVGQHQLDRQDIEKAISEGKIKNSGNEEDIYYYILKEGTGRQVTLDDTLSVFYKGYLFPDGEVFDQTGTTPAKFPLKRLIRGWQVGLVKAKVGGKMLLVIPSAQAYSIRTRAAKIPPNSILVFEIEVLDAMSPK